MKGKTPDVYSPKFIPVYPELFEAGLGWLEVVIYGFVSFYLERGGDTAFYFSNEGIAKAIGKPDMDEATISRAIKGLVRFGLIKVEYKIRAGGGKIRYIRLDEKVNSDLTKKSTLTWRKSQGNNNKINNNNNIYKYIGDKSPADILEDIEFEDAPIDSLQGEEEQSYGNELINRILDGPEKFFGYDLPRDAKARRIANNMLKLATKKNKRGLAKKGREFLDDDAMENLSRFFSDLEHRYIDKGLAFESWFAVYDKLKLWIANKGKFPNSK